MITKEDEGKRCIYTTNNPTDVPRFWTPGIVKTVGPTDATVKHWFFGEWKTVVVPHENIFVTSPAPLPPQNYLVDTQPLKEDLRLNSQGPT